MINPHTQQSPRIRVQRGFPELVGVHFAKTLIALDREALPARSEDGLEQAGWPCNFDITALFVAQNGWFGINFAHGLRPLGQTFCILTGEHLLIKHGFFIDPAHSALQNQAAVFKLAFPSVFAFFRDHVQPCRRGRSFVATGSRSQRAGNGGMLDQKARCP